MKTFLILSLLCGLVIAENIDVDWTKVKPLPEYAEFRGDQQQASDDGPSKFIIGGQNSEPHQFPFHVGLLQQMPFGESLCGGSLISRWSILTAASCLQGSESSLVFLGAHNLMDNSERYQARFRVPATNYRVHPEFVRNGRAISNDVAIVRLPFQIAFLHRAVNVVLLPTPLDQTNSFNNFNAVIMGFGRHAITSTSNAYMSRYSQVVTISNDICRWAQNMVDVNAGHICTAGGTFQNGRSLCSGSLGSPLVIRRDDQFVQIGIASVYSPNCARNQPSGFTRITHRPIFDWIQENV